MPFWFCLLMVIIFTVIGVGSSVMYALALALLAIHFNVTMWQVAGALGGIAGFIVALLWLWWIHATDITEEERVQGR